MLKICNVYGHDAVSVCVAQNWFKRFQSGNFYVKDAPHFDQPTKSMKSWKKLSKKLNNDHKTILNHLKKAEYKKNSMFGCHMI